jgi:hypothetical protein
MRTSDAFPSNYLRAADLKGKTPIVTIDRVVMETLGRESKLVVYFRKAEKGLVLNKTNAMAIADLAGTEETDDWPGKKIRLIQAMVEYQGKREPAVRVEDARGQVAPPKPPPVVEAVPDPEDDDEPIF